ncbi:MAG: long-chain fatty acid--CoA ligase [Flavisolibacter sp.]
MNKPQRLFDCLDLHLKERQNDPLLVSKEGGQWRNYTTGEVKTIVDSLSAGLLSLGVSSRDMTVEGRSKIAIISKNRPEWIFVDLAVQQIGAILVPLYPTAHVNDLAFILRDAEVEFAFVNDLELLEKVQKIQGNVPSLKAVFTFEETSQAPHWKTLLTKGVQHHYEQISTHSSKILSEDLLTIIYTSGTTGTPKGVMLSHHNILSNVESTLPILPLNKNSRVLSFLPLNHIFERMVTYVYLFAGCTIYYAESMDTIGDNIREVRPEMFTTVPRLLEKVYERILSKASELKGVKKKLFDWALHLAEKYDINKKGSLNYRMQLLLANKIIFPKWRKALGNSIACIVTGAAACQVRLIRIFTAAGIPILEGYGQTETSPVISVNKLSGRMFGTVGPVIEGVTVKIAEDGEVLCKGPNVMMGYFKRPDLTVETVREGWLYTGDIGIMVDNQFLKITDRKKEIFKTSGGKYVAPQPIENKMVESSFIEQIMVIGAEQKFVAAFIVPSFQVLDDWLTKNNIPLNNKELIVADLNVLELYQRIVDDMNRNFNHVEQIKKFALLPHAWSVEGGELTPTLKLKRKIILDTNKKVFEKIYGN